MNDTDQADSILDRICIAMPCSVDWDSMKGNDEVRLCGGCNKNVYNISAMSKKEAEEILSGPTLPCLQILRNEDGMLITDECPPLFKPIRSYWRRTAGFFLSLIAVISPQIASADDKMKQFYLRGRPATVNNASPPSSKTPLSKILRRSKYATYLGRPCEVRPDLKHGTKEWREGFTRTHWPTSLLLLRFSSDDLPLLYGDQLSQLSKITPDAVTIEPPGKSEIVTTLYAEPWLKVERAREQHMRACMHFLRKEAQECIRNCDASAAFYREAYEGVKAVPNFDKEFERFIKLENEKVLALRAEANKPAVPVSENK